MKERSADDLLRLADAIAQKTPIDWDRELGAPDLRDEMESLRQVERIVRAHEELRGGAGTDDPDRLEGATLAHYKLVEKIGTGGMGVVYRGRDERLERDVAIKVLRAERVGDEAARRALLREARIACSIAHPNVAAIYDVGEARDHLFFVMEYVEGATAHEEAHGRGVGVRTSVAHGIQIAGALHAAHRAGIVHRDLKSLNICVTAAGHVKVLDFGLAVRTRTPSPGEATASESGFVPAGVPAGTLAYMSPESIRGEPVDARTDLWSLGVILFELLTGRRPFSGERASDLERSILHDEPAALPESVPLALRRIVARCLEKDARRRYQGAGEVRGALEAVLDTIPKSGRTPPLPRWARSGAAVAAAAGLTVWLSASYVLPWVFRQLADAGPATTMVVLPIRNEMGSPDQDFLAQGLTDQLINTFAGLAPIRVLSRTSSEAIGRDRRAIPELARVYELDMVLEGSIHRLGERIRINVRLVDARKDQPLWAHSFDRSIQDLPTLDRDIALAVAEQTQTRLTPAERAGLGSPRSRDLRSYRSYVRGRQLFADRSYGPALEHFMEATRLDSTFASAYAGMADSYTEMLYHRQIAASVALPRAMGAALRALMLDSTQADARLALAFVHGLQWNWSEAERELSRALADQPGSAEAWYRQCLYLGVMNRPRDHLDAMKRAAWLDPLSSRFGTELGLAHLNAREVRNAATQFRLVIETEEGSERRRCQAYLARCLALLGRPGEAMDSLSRWQREIAASGARPTTLELEELAYVQARLGDRDGAGRTLERLRGAGEDDPASPLAIAAAQTTLGDLEGAIATLEEACRAHDTRIVWVQIDQRFDPIRRDPRYGAILARMGLRSARAA